MRKIALTVVALAAACWAGPAAAGGKGTAVELDGLKSTAPAAWKPAEKLSKFRIYQFALPKADADKEDAELVIFAFGPGGGGGVKENIKRWQGTFAPPAGKTFDDVTKVETFKVGSVPVTYVEISGTYLYKFPPAAPNAKLTPKENFRMIGVIFESDKEGPYFMRLTGPARTVEASKKAFDEWLKGFK
jgi:gluconolactonase